MRTAALITLAGAVLFSGCVSVQTNPQFSKCANACTNRQDACMLNASTGDEVAKCNTTFDACVTSCEKKYPRYL